MNDTIAKIVYLKSSYSPHLDYVYHIPNVSILLTNYHNKPLNFLPLIDGSKTLTSSSHEVVVPNDGTPFHKNDIKAELFSQVVIDSTISASQADTDPQSHGKGFYYSISCLLHLNPVDTKLLEFQEAQQSLLAAFQCRECVMLLCMQLLNKELEGLRCVPKSTHHIISAIADTERRLSGVQFHPEVDITKNGRKMLHNFLFDICGLQRGFTLEKREQQYIDYVRRTVGRNKIVFMLESGGVDSAVCAALLYKALLQDDDSSRVHEIHIDNGFLR
ncbi:hypothetical protein OUZ56_026779 [Daphnia magna]|uniref:GMPS ATP-PPase domain-containing protein n=1 Tax=Daphnia magna TaxID=35525 RepID=A0ABQ9ZMS7_9CRUS|nr:hypothetical protein OUZ56_026779 [Daphnia magna]